MSTTSTGSRTGAYGTPALALWAALVLALGTLASACGDGGTGPDGDGDGDGSIVELDLAAGESDVLDGGDQVLRVLLPADGGDAEYRIALHTTHENAGVTAMRLSTSTGGSSLTAARATAGAGAGQGLVRGAGQSATLSGELDAEERSLLLRHRIHESSRRLLQREDILPARPDARRSTELRAATLPTEETPQEGDTLEISYMVQPDLSVSCQEQDATTLTGVVRAVGQRVAMVEDTAVSALVSPNMDYASLANEFDTVVFGVNQAYFGDPSDIDGNQRVLVFLTPEVNKLTEPGSESRIGGFFVSADLAESGDPMGDGTEAGGLCPASNESELLYLLAPDPTGQFGDAVTSERAKRNARSVSAHEFEHLLNAANRLFVGGGGFDDLPATWLDEGLAHLAEEVAGFRKIGESLRSNLDLSDVTETRAEVDAFNTFHIANYQRLRRYFLDPAGSSVLVLSDPGGVESLQMRGFAWLFVRWLGDQEGPAGDGVLDGSREQELFRGLAQADGDLTQGVQNVEEETGKTWAQLISEFVVMPAVDDSAPGDVSARLELPTWNLPAVFRGLHENEGSSEGFPEPYPLDVTESGFVATTFDVEVEAGTAHHIWFSAGGSTPDLTLELTDAGGGSLPSGVRVTVVRAQ